jgi:hypothetical protein
MKIENNIQGIVNGNGIKSLLSETLPDGSGTFFFVLRGIRDLVLL